MIIKYKGFELFVCPLGFKIAKAHMGFMDFEGIMALVDEIIRNRNRGLV